MSFDFLTEHQIHILLRVLTIGGLFFGVVGFLIYLSKRHAARQKDMKRSGSHGQEVILATDLWRRKSKRKKGRR